MGCICSKGVGRDETAVVVDAHAAFKKEPAKPLPLPAASCEKVEPVSGVGDDEKKATARNSSVHRPQPVDAEPDSGDVVGDNAAGANHTIADDVANGFSGEHATSSGWPNWLTSVAGEAIQGWSPRRTNSFKKLEKIGQGTYSSVYRAREIATGKMVALKKVRFVNMDPESVRFMAREIHILRRLDHPNVIKLQGIVASRMSCSLYLVFDYMDHDLNGLAATPGFKFTQPQIKCLMQQLLSGLEHCHGRGVLHRDIKGSNLLIDGDGVLRIGDLGLAAVFDPDERQPMTSRVVTLWYRPPELLLGATEYGVAVDLWSTGCILAELLAGKPIMSGRTEVEQLHKIFKLCGSPSEDYWRRSKLPNATIFKPQRRYPRRVAETFRDFPSSALALLDVLLAIEPDERGTAASALQSDFFTRKPLACDPSSLPKFPPSKEYATKLREEEARRQREASLKAQGSEFVSRTTRDTKAKPTRDDSIEKQKSSEKYSPERDCPRAGSTVHPGAYGTSRNGDHCAAPARCNSTMRPSNMPQLRTQRSCVPRSGDPSNFSGSVAAARSGTSSRYVAEPAEKPQELDRTVSCRKKDGGGKDSTVGYESKSRRIHYSGPLMAAGGSIEEMLKEHERQIQEAVRKARLDKAKTKAWAPSTGDDT